jgi:pyruvate dehydrogenase E2 component (dihydrolipoamide acetyltransferase)
VTSQVLAADGDAELLEEVPLTGIRGVIARRLTDSLRDSAQLTLHREADTSELVAYRRSLKEEGRPSFNDLMLFAVAHVLTRHPLLNATLENDTVYRWRSVHLGTAVAIEDGLIVPVLRNANRLTLPELQLEAARLHALARERKLGVTDVQGGTFTVTNLGSFGIDGFTPILNPPQVGILGIGRVRDGATTLSLTIDHRALDGVPGAQFLAELAELLMRPSEW